LRAPDRGRSRDSSGIAALRELLGEADVVIEASRPRALEALGVAATPVRPDIVPKVWVRITGHGRGAGAMRVAFGDDAAVAGGRVARDAYGPVFAGDAIADPLTGLMAAIAALACLSAPGAWLVDLAMGDIAAWTCRGGGTSAAVVAVPPRARTDDVPTGRC
jgi:crotonobetainyl-CoA:carnitine CoA-transferase CaiB-like acyl-CoA transferase